MAVALPGVQHAISRRASSELSALLGTDVMIKNVDIALFNRVVLKSVTVEDDEGKTALCVDHLGAGVNIFESLWKQRLIITYIELVGADVRLYRPSAGEPLNIQLIIDRLKKSDSQGSKSFDLAVNLLVIRRSGFGYDVLDAPHYEDGRFDPSHIYVGDIKADISAPVISNEKIEGHIRRLMAKERSGIVLTDLLADVLVDTAQMTVKNFLISTPRSRFAFEDIVAVSPLSQRFSPDNLLLSSLTTQPESYFNISDLSPFVADTEKANIRVDVDLSVKGDLKLIQLERLNLKLADRDVRLSAHGEITDVKGGLENMGLAIDDLDLHFNTANFLDYIKQPSSPLTALYDKIAWLRPLGTISLTGNLTLNHQNTDFEGVLDSEKGLLNISADLLKHSNAPGLEILGSVTSDSFDPSEFHHSLSPLTDIAFSAEADLSVGSKGNMDGDAKLAISHLQWKDYKFENIEADAKFEGRRIEALLMSASQILNFEMKGVLDRTERLPSTSLFANIEHISLAPFLNSSQYKDFILSMDLEAATSGLKPDEISGSVSIENLLFTNYTDKTIKFDKVTLDSEVTDTLRTLSISSPVVDGTITGDFKFSSLSRDLKSLVSAVFPALFKHDKSDLALYDNFSIEGDLLMKEDSVLPRFFNLPVEIIYPVTLTAAARGGQDANMEISLDMPYLKNKDKLIEDTRLSLRLDGNAGTGELIAHSSIPTKNGMLGLNINSEGVSDSLFTNVSWVIEREKDFKGNLKFLTNFIREEAGDPLTTSIKVGKSSMVFNDSVWNVSPGEILIAPGKIMVNSLSGGRYGQSLSVNGVASADSTERLVVKLDNIDLDYIFETLNISDAVQFGGRATGEFYGIGLLSKSPILYTPELKVTKLKYNGCVMGDGAITSYWDNRDKSVNINAVIDQLNGEKSLINGFIRPATEELDFRFSAQNAPVGFMAPFMSAFTSKISGEVSGEAHLFGTFKDLDMTGDILVKDLSLKLDFTNVTYTTTDSVHIAPGLIKFSNVKLTDRYGKTGSLSGYVTHNYFHDPTFSFNVTDAKDLLVYDVAENATEDPWYGKIFGNGTAVVKGEPGHVDINVAMSTAPKSTFTFVLSDAEQALDYTFITLRDRDRFKKDSIAALDSIPAMVKKLRERVKNEEQPEESLYTMSFEVDVTPVATMNLVMDPVGGDKITAHGSGHMRMTYSSTGDLRMYGDYTINRGSYNFTLQDIIIKDFTIREGSKISFLGDPYAAQLDITASYSVNANLSDLDESFLSDRELNRTNVPVDALLMVKGDMRQPDVTFDLYFPTLNSDTYRKVKSIISTEDMMNRQIIYLLALNKFYTPDYMNATHGNELVSVASSTISSRISSMLGQLSNNWSIAPAIRSDRGDFSDVEVDVALSSNLLNNRLLFNGNFGYRDKSLNNNSFIGDFDIRYLLNRAGTLQLKAYNRYNDQNYYLKSATTTQGVGIVFKRDFDNILSFIRGLRGKRNDTAEKEKEASQDSTRSKPVVTE